MSTAIMPPAPSWPKGFPSSCPAQSGEPSSRTAKSATLFDERYSVDTSMSGEQPRYAYSQQAVDLILSTLRQDPERALDRLKAETEKK